MIDAIFQLWHLHYSLKMAWLCIYSMLMPKEWLSPLDMLGIYNCKNYFMVDGSIIYLSGEDGSNILIDKWTLFGWISQSASERCTSLLNQLPSPFINLILLWKHDPNFVLNMHCSFMAVVVGNLSYVALCRRQNMNLIWRVRVQWHWLFFFSAITWK